MNEAQRATSEQATGVSIRPGEERDLARIVEIYNHYVAHTAITFDLEPVSVENRRSWFEAFGQEGRHRLFIAEAARAVVGYAYSHQFRDRAAYDPTIEVTVYLDPESRGRGIGTKLYGALFDAVADQELHLAVAGITLPNKASVALHEGFGFQRVGVNHEIGRKFGRFWDVAWYEKRLG